MAKDELIDAHVSSKQVRKAVEALLAHELKKQEEKQETELLPGKEPNVWLNITVKKMSPTKSLKPIKIPIAHPIVDPRTTGVCLITKDPQREYKDLLENQGIKFISRVVGIEKLKGKFKPFEARRMLLKENGLFLADERVIPLLPKLLGSKWFEAKKQPLPVSLTRKDLKGELEQAISSTYMNQNKGTCTAIKVGIISQKSTQVVANIKMAIPTIVKHIKEGWSNIQSLHIKTNSSTSLPIWSCELGDEEGGRWDGLVAASDDDEENGSDDQDKSEEDEEEEEPSEEEELAKPSPPPQKKAKKRAPEEENEPEKPKKRAKSSTSEVASKKTAAPAPTKPTSDAKKSAASPATKPPSQDTAKPSDSRPPKKSAASATPTTPPTPKKSKSSSGDKKAVDKKSEPPAVDEKPKSSETKKSKSEPVKKSKPAAKEKKSKPSETTTPKEVAPVVEKAKTKSIPSPPEKEPQSSDTGKKVKSSGTEKKSKTSKSLKDSVLGKKPGKR